MRITALPLLAVASLVTAPAADAAGAGTLTIRVTNVRNAKGLVHAEACPQASFLKEDCVHGASVPAREGVTVIVLHGVPAGTYAVQAFHDENSNKKVDRNFLGIPREGVGFSNDAPIRLGPPKWADAKFDFNGNDQTIQLKTRYFLGPSGPGQR